MSTTPQRFARDVAAAVKMFEQVAIPVLGGIENFVLRSADMPGKNATTFSGTGGGPQLAAEIIKIFGLSSAR